MRRLSFILVLTILMGGLSLTTAHASESQKMAPTSILLADASVQPSSGFLSGIATALDNVVNSVINAVKSMFGFEPSTPKVATLEPAVKPAPLPPTDLKPIESVPLSVSMPKPAIAPAPIVKAPTQLFAPPPPSMADGLSPESDPAMLGGEAEAMGGKVPFSQFPKSASVFAPKVGTAATPSVAKPPVAPATAATAGATGVAAAKPATAPAAVADSSIVKASSTKDPLGFSAVDAGPKIAAAVAPVVAAAPTAVDALPSRSDTSASSASTASAAPMLYSQPIVAVLAPARTTATETPVSRPSPTTIAAAPVSRVPVAVANPRFIDSIILPIMEPASRVAVTEGRTDTTVATRDSAILATRDAALQTRTAADARASIPTDLMPNNATVDPATVTAGRATTSETPVVTAPLVGGRMIILSDGTQQVVIQTTADTTTIIDPASTEAVVCKTAGDFPILSLGDDDAGLTRAVVFAGGTILLKPTDFFKKFVRLEGAANAFDAPAKDCSLTGLLGRLTTPDLIVTMPKLSETERELVSAKAVVGNAGRVYIVAADNAAVKMLRGIIVREADGKILFKMFPERNQLSQAVRSMTAMGDLTGRIMVDLVLNTSDGTTTTPHCEFSKDIDMTCTTRGAL